MLETIKKIISNLTFKFPYTAEDYAENLYIENYHKHTDFSNTSTADCAESIESYAKQTIEYKGKCLFSGEHGSQGNQFLVYNVAESNDLKYRHSVEAYWVKDRLEKDNKNCHICLIATNPEGREDINFALSMANIDGYYYKPRIDLELLFNIPKDNIIVTSACFTEDMMVQTNNGYKKIIDVKSEDKVLTHMGTWENVITPTQRNYEGKLFSLNVEGCSKEIKCTNNHKFPTVQKTHNDITKNIIWKRADELTTKDRILSVVDMAYDDLDSLDFTELLDNLNKKNNRNRKHIKDKKIKIDNEFLELLGIYTAEGNLNNTNKDGITFTLNLKDTMICEKVIKYSKKIFGIEPDVRIRENETRMDIRIGSTEVYEIFNYLFNSGAKNKEIPSFVLKLEPNKQMQFIKGLFNGDGHLCKNECKVTYCTISRELALQVIDVLERNDIKVASHYSNEFIDNNNIHHNESYIIDINKQGFREYWDKFRLGIYDYDYDWLNEVNWKSKKPIFIDGIKYHHKKINRITTSNYNGMVYCLNVENTHSFKCESISVHNCVAGWKYEDAEDIWLKCANYFGDNFFLEVQYHDTESQKKLNQKILKLAKKHNIQLICGLDSHYVKPENTIKRDQILKYKGIHYDDEDGWYMDYPKGQEIFRRFKEQGILTDEEILTAMMNTNVFINECEEIILDRNFKIPCVYPNTTYKERVKIFHNILNKRYKLEKLKSNEKAKGIVYEANEVTESGVVDYFLTNEKIVSNAVENKGGILTTTSRGSSASFITNKLLGFTTIDRFNSEIPIYPERFLTKERVLAGQMPDIDYNVATQEPFIESARELIGKHSCYPLMAIEKLKVKNAWQLYASVNDVTPETANEISKSIEKYNEKLKYAEEEDKEFINIEDFIPEQYIDIYRQSLEYQGITINLKVHACGYLMLEGDIRRKIGLITAISETTGKKTLCACIEGGMLDEFGYVKDDFLIVDSVHLTHKFFQSINQSVPSFDELREMIKDDKRTWEIYEKGITCCINQCEKESTTRKVKQYKPQNLAELSAFIAGIRPGFKSLINTFISRKPYSTGEPKIDELLKDSYHFMIYQESIMKILGFLDVLMAETYGVIKSISKKKLKGKKLEDLMKNLKLSWNKHFGNLNNFNNIWNVIEDSARYAFNSPHALSMGGDSAYQAWFKAHYTAKFYEVAINHYQDKNKKDKIDALIKEAMTFYRFKLGNYEFGKDNRRVNIDEEHKIIYPNLSSVKGFGEKVVEELYELGLNQYKDFREVLSSIKGTKINQSIVDKLIKLNYFKQFGDVNYLLEIVKITNIFDDAKEISKEKAMKLGYDINFLLMYGHETAKKITKLEIDKLIPDLIGNIKAKSMTLQEVLDNQQEILGILSYINPKISKRIFYISELEVLKSITKIKLYQINTGKIIDMKMWTNQYNRNPFDKCDFIYIDKYDKKLQKAPTGETNPETGKRIYREVEGSYEYWLSLYRNVTDTMEGIEDIND